MSETNVPLDPYEARYLLAIAQEELDSQTAEDRFYSFADEELSDLIRKLARAAGDE